MMAVTIVTPCDVSAHVGAGLVIIQANIQALPYDSGGDWRHGPLKTGGFADTFTRKQNAPA